MRGPPKGPLNPTCRGQLWTALLTTDVHTPGRTGTKKVSSHSGEEAWGRHSGAGERHDGVRACSNALDRPVTVASQT